MLAVAPVTAGPLLEPLTAGTLTLTPDEARLSAVGGTFTMSALAAPFAASLYPTCEPCLPGTLIRLSAGWIDSVDVLVAYDFDPTPPPIAGPDAGPTLLVAAGSIVLPEVAAAFAASTPFTLTVIEDPTEAPPSPGMVASGSGIARVRFTGDADGWHLVDVVYTLVPPPPPPGHGHHRPPRP
jgi:hypothetical protein